MQNFYYDIPTKVFFGEGQIQNLPELVSEFGQRALLVYGGGSVKRSGLYDTIVSLLQKAVGIYRQSSLMKAGLVGSQAV